MLIIGYHPYGVILCESEPAGWERDRCNETVTTDILFYGSLRSIT